MKATEPGNKQTAMLTIHRPLLEALLKQELPSQCDFDQSIGEIYFS